MLEWLALQLLAVSAPAAAQDQFEQAQAVRVQPGPKRYFYQDYPDGCPAVTAKCRGRAYVMPGDRLVAFEARGGLTRVAYTAESGRTTEGWIETAALRALDPLAPAPDSWLGEWTINGRGWEARLTITRSAAPGKLHIEGGAESGTDNPWRVEHGAVHIGQVAAEVDAGGPVLSFSTADYDEPGAVPTMSEEGDEWGTLPYDAPSAGPQTFGDDRCRMRMRMVGPYLLVEDNGDCGAQGVTFSGPYRR